MVIWYLLANFESDVRRGRRLRELLHVFLSELLKVLMTLLRTCVNDSQCDEVNLGHGHPGWSDGGRTMPTQRI